MRSVSALDAAADEQQRRQPSPPHTSSPPNTTTSSSSHLTTSTDEPASSSSHTNNHSPHRNNSPKSATQQQRRTRGQTDLVRSTSRPAPVPIAMQRAGAASAHGVSAVASEIAGASPPRHVARFDAAETRRRELLGLLSSENLAKLAQAYERSVSLPIPVPSARPSNASVSRSAPFFDHDDNDDDDDDDDDNDDDDGRGDRMSASAPPSAALTARTHDELECSLCFRLFYQPMTSHCGHSFCAPCYAQLVRHSNSCALCREPLSATPPGVNVALRGVAQSAFPDEFLARTEEGRREEDELERARARSRQQENERANAAGDDDNDDDAAASNVFCLTSLTTLLCAPPDRQPQDEPIELN